MTTRRQRTPAVRRVKAVEYPRRSVTSCTRCVTHCKGEPALDALQHFFSAIWSAVLSVFVWLGLATAPIPSSFQGYVEGEFVLVAPTVGGTLETRPIRRGDQIAEGALLFTLDRTDETAARDQAKAALTAARERYDNLSKGKRPEEIAVIEAQKAQAEAQLRLMQQQLDRQRRLSKSAAFAQEQFDQAVANHDLQQARVKELTAQLATARMTLGREDELHAAEADVAAADAALAQAQWRLDQKSRSAPVAGLVSDTYFDPGEMIAAGQAVVSILAPGNIKVRFFVPERALARVPVGAKVLIHCDSCKAEIPAKVRFVSPSAEYTPPVLYNRENRDRLVFMIEAYPTENAVTLRPGQPVDVRLAAP